MDEMKPFRKALGENTCLQQIKPSSRQMAGEKWMKD
jgi:hypothetical protein